MERVVNELRFTMCAAFLKGFACESFRPFHIAKSSQHLSDRHSTTRCEFGGTKLTVGSNAFFHGMQRSRVIVQRVLGPADAFECECQLECIITVPPQFYALLGQRAGRSRFSLPIQDH